MPDLNPLTDWFPPEGFKILLTLFLSFLIGLEREERVAGEGTRGFGGVRTFPLIGLVGYGTAVLSGAQVWAVALVLVAIAGFLILSYWHKLTTAPTAGVTSEMSALATYLIGALVAYDHFWIATTMCVAGMILLELKAGLEGLARRLGADEIFTFTKFLLLAAVILPIVPNHDYTAFAINPFKTWLVVVAVSAISYGSYIVQKLTKGRGDVLLAALLGGAYSSTLTTIVLAKRARSDPRARVISGAILAASGVMYLRLAILLALFNNALMLRLAPSFVALALLALIVAFFWSRVDAGKSVGSDAGHEAPNPLEIRAALGFAALFVAMLITGHLASLYLGRSGVYALAAVMGVADVDPFILSMTQQTGASTAATVATSAILIAAASNNVAKGVYAYAFAPRQTGLYSLMLLLGLALAGLVPLLFQAI